MSDHEETVKLTMHLPKDFGEPTTADLLAEIARLKAEVEQIKTVEFPKRVENVTKTLKAKLAEAEAKGVRMGLERAREIVATGNIDQLSDAIDAEIAKAGD